MIVHSDERALEVSGAHIEDIVIGYLEAQLWAVPNCSGMTAAERCASP